MAECGLFWGIIWFIILLVFGFPIGFFCAIFYVLLSPLAACCSSLSEVMNLLDRGIKLPFTCTQNMITGKAMC